MLMFGIGGREPGDAKDTGNIIRRTGEFVVNLVGYDERRGDERHRDRVRRRHRRAGTRPGSPPRRRSKVKPPRIAESPVSFECERFMLIDLCTSRTLVLGRILAMHVRDDAVLDRDAATSTRRSST